MRSSDRFLVLLAGLLPILMLGGLAWWITNTDLNRAAMAAAETAVADADRLFNRIAQRLQAQKELPGQPCTPETVEALHHLVFDTMVIRSAELYDIAHQLYCTTGGPTGGEHRATGAQAPGLNIFVVTVPESDLTLVVDLTRDDGAAIEAFANPALFSELATPFPFAADGALRVGLKDGSMLRRVGPAIDNFPLDAIGAAATSSYYDITADVRLSRAVFIARFVEQLEIFGGVSLGLSGLLMWLTQRGNTRRQSLTWALRVALHDRQFEVLYQPIMDIQNPHCVGAEALMRWRHPSRGLVRPDLFIPTAEESGLILPMTRWLMYRVRDDFEDMNTASDFHVSINLSPAHLNNAAIVDDIRAIFGGRVLSPARLVLEATERNPINDTGAAVIDALRTMGPAIAIDDFGTGHSGLAYLQKFRFDFLKIDQAFVRAIGTDAVNRTVVDSIIQLAHQLDMEIIAEGIETPEQLAYLRQAGVRYGQGFLFAHPMPRDDLQIFIDTPIEAALAVCD
jgi:sensor c-di-GMP phosphodiesterase-like protein